MRAGQHIVVRVTAHRGGRIMDSGTVTARFWAPGSDLAAEPDRQAGAVFDPRTRRWAAVVDTAGWAPGTWRMMPLADDGTAVGGTAEPLTFELDA